MTGNGAYVRCQPDPGRGRPVLAFASWVWTGTRISATRNLIGVQESLFLNAKNRVVVKSIDFLGSRR